MGYFTGENLPTSVNWKNLLLVNCLARLVKSDKSYESSPLSKERLLLDNLRGLPTFSCMFGLCNFFKCLRFFTS